MKTTEYEKLVKSIIKKEKPIKNMLIAFISGGLMGALGELLFNLYMNSFNLTRSDGYLYVFITFVVLGSIFTGLGFFDKLLSICKCGLIVPSTGFANSMTSSAMDYKSEGYVKGLGANIFKLTGSIILYGVVFGVIFGYIRSFFV